MLLKLSIELKRRKRVGRVGRLLLVLLVLVRRVLSRWMLVRVLVCRRERSASARGREEVERGRRNDAV